jgi:F0F1-type ATP synthase membrane subunit b/b'
MISTAEFWVFIAFLICLGLSVKLVVPKIITILTVYQKNVEDMFVDAENTLLGAQRKFAATKERVEGADIEMVRIETEFESKVNYQLQTWDNQKKKLVAKYHQAQELGLQHLKNHMENELYNQIILSCENLLQMYLAQHLGLEEHKQLIKSALKHLPATKSV